MKEKWRKQHIVSRLSHWARKSCFQQSDSTGEGMGSLDHYWRDGRKAFCWGVSEAMASVSIGGFWKLICQISVTGCLPLLRGMDQKILQNPSFCDAVRTFPEVARYSHRGKVSCIKCYLSSLPAGDAFKGCQAVFQVEGKKLIQEFLGDFCLFMCHKTSEHGSDWNQQSGRKTSNKEQTSSQILTWFLVPGKQLYSTRGGRNSWTPILVFALLVWSKCLSRREMPGYLFA